jgi:hypothetical protein
VTGRLAQADAPEAHAGPPGRPDGQTPSPGMAYVAYAMRIPAGHPVTRLPGQGLPTWQALAGAQFRMWPDGESPAGPHTFHRAPVKLAGL